jgi:hypothetical protein
MFLGSTVRQVCRADNLAAICEPIVYTEFLTSHSQHYRPPRSVTGIALLLFFMVFLLISKNILFTQWEKDKNCLKYFTTLTEVYTEKWKCYTWVKYVHLKITTCSYVADTWTWTTTDISELMWDFWEAKVDKPRQRERGGGEELEKCKDIYNISIVSKKKKKSKAIPCNSPWRPTGLRC